MHHDLCFRFIIVVVISSHLLVNVVVARHGNRGGALTFNLISADARRSPFRTHENAPDALDRRLHRVSPRGLAILHPKSGISTAADTGGRDNTAPVSAFMGNHLMRISVGTPPVDVHLIADTGSDLTWTQCSPCPGCYKQIHPPFEPKKSLSYRSVSCRAMECPLFINNPKCASAENSCQYSYGYADNSNTEGLLSIEKFHVTSSSGRPVSLDMFFGCGHNDTGTFNDHMTGIIGLGSGPLSFLSQMSAAAGGKKMMSQCLMPYRTDPNIVGRISFGTSAAQVNGAIFSIPMVAPYTAVLHGVSVGNVFMPYQLGTPGGSMFFDSGTPMTYVPSDLYQNIIAEVERQVPMVALEDEDPERKQLCYRTDRYPIGPNMTFRFKGGSVKLTTVQTFTPSPKMGGVYCLAIAGAGEESDGGIFGNIAQANFVIGFDLEAMKISFKPTDCTKKWW